MKYIIKVTKDDLKFVNTPPTQDYRYGITNVLVRVKDGRLLFETSDSHILIRKSFVADREEEAEENARLMFTPEFFKRLIYLCKQKELITIVVDFENKLITGKTLYCEITSQHITETHYPDTDRAYPEKDGDVSIVFRKDLLEKMLNSLPSRDSFLEFSFQDSVEPWKEPVIVKTSKTADKFDGDKNLIMGVRPDGRHW